MKGSLSQRDESKHLSQTNTAEVRPDLPFLRRQSGPRDQRDPRMLHPIQLVCWPRECCSRLVMVVRLDVLVSLTVAVVGIINTKVWPNSDASMPFCIDATIDAMAHLVVSMPFPRCHFPDAMAQVDAICFRCHSMPFDAIRMPFGIGCHSVSRLNV